MITHSDGCMIGNTGKMLQEKGQAGFCSSFHCRKYFNLSDNGLSLSPILETEYFLRPPLITFFLFFALHSPFSPMYHPNYVNWLHINVASPQLHTCENIATLLPKVKYLQKPPSHWN